MLRKERNNELQRKRYAFNPLNQMINSERQYERKLAKHAEKYIKWRKEYVEWKKSRK